MRHVVVAIVPTLYTPHAEGNFLKYRTLELVPTEYYRVFYKYVCIQVVAY